MKFSPLYIFFGFFISFGLCSFGQAATQWTPGDNERSKIKMKADLDRSVAQGDTISAAVLDDALAVEPIELPSGNWTLSGKITRVLQGDFILGSCTLGSMPFEQQYEGSFKIQFRSGIYTWSSRGNGILRAVKLPEQIELHSTNGLDGMVQLVKRKGKIVFYEMSLVRGIAYVNSGFADFKLE